MIWILYDHLLEFERMDACFPRFEFLTEDMFEEFIFEFYDSYFILYIQAMSSTLFWYFLELLRVLLLLKSIVADFLP